MNSSEQLNELFTALSKAQAEFDHAKKDISNDFYKSKYADLASCIDAAKYHLAKNNLCVSQLTSINEQGEIVLTTILGHSSGQFIKSEYPLRPVKTDPQGYGSALMYARRYCFCAITGIASDDDDGNAASNLKKPIDYEAELKKVKNLVELKTAWIKTPPEARAKLEEVKDQIKAKLTPPVITDNAQGGGNE